MRKCYLLSPLNCIKKNCSFVSGRRHRLDPLITRSPTPPILIRERQLSVSSRSSLTSEIHQRRKIEVESPLEYIPTAASPTYADDYDTVDRKKRKKKEKKHKKDKKSKKKKKKKHRSRSTSQESDGSESEKSRSSSVKRTPPAIRRDVETLSDWEHHEHSKSTTVIDHKVGIDTSACSPVSNDSDIGSPETVFEVQSPTPPRVTPPVKPYRDYRDYAAKESPHTPPVHHSSRYCTSLCYRSLFDT